MKWGLIICAALGALLLAACGGGSGGASTNGNSELFTTAGFQQASDAVKEKAGENAQVLQVQITGGGADFKLRSGEQATGFVYTGGDLHDEQVDIIGPGSLEGQDFPFSEIDPGAIDKIVSGVKEKAGVSDLEVTVMTLEKSSIDGRLKWTINAAGGGRTGLVYNAEPDGSNVTSPVGDIAGGGTTVTAPNGKTPQQISDCIQKAGTDVSKIQACTR
ncbi:MAG: hypothetical protein WBQ41_15160 [Solirubrobacterales bacterium]